MYNNDLIAVAVTFINKKSILTQRKIFWKENIVFNYNFFRDKFRSRTCKCDPIIHRVWNHANSNG